MSQPIYSLKQLAAHLKNKVWDSGDDCCLFCRFYTSYPGDTYCSADSCLQCEGFLCENYKNYLETWYTGEELEAFSTCDWRNMDQLVAVYIALNDFMTVREALPIVSQYQFILMLKEQSSCK